MTTVLLRLRSGQIVVVWNPSVRSAYARQSLVMSVSDDGRTFYGFREIAHADYPMSSINSRWCVTYPALAEAPDGITRLRDLVLQLAVRGRLVPQDPDDEPVCVLLERIAAEQARLVKVIRAGKQLKLDEAALDAVQGRAS